MLSCHGDSQSQIVVCKPAPSVSPADLHKITVLRLHRQLTKSETLGVGPAIYVSTSLLGDCEACSILREILSWGIPGGRQPGCSREFIPDCRNHSGLKDLQRLMSETTFGIYTGVVSSYSICEKRARFPQCFLRRQTSEKND